MNVSKMLNLLILIFLLMNVGLYYLIDVQNSDIYTLSKEREDQLRDILMDRGISLTVFFPDFEPRPRLVILAPEDETEDELIKVIFEGESPEVNRTDTATIYSTVYERLTFDQGDEKGLVFYGATVPQYVPKVFDQKSYNEVVDRFVQDFTLGKGTYEITDTRISEGNKEDPEDDFILYYFNERYEGELVFSNEVVVKLDKYKGISEARAIKYEIYDFESKPIPLIELDEVLYAFMYYLRSINDDFITITDIDLGYYIGVDNQERFVSKIMDPYYRIKLSSGETYYYDAYTNEMVK